MDSNFDNRTISGAPRELLGPLPRKAKIYSTDGRYALAVAVITILGPALLLGQYCFNDIKQMRQRAVLRSNSCEAVGEVTSLVTERGGPDVARYTFSINGTTYSGEAMMPDYSGAVLARSSRILIRFLPSNPAVNHPSGWEWSPWMNLAHPLFSLFFITIGSFVMTLLWREWRLAREGKVVVAVVTSCTPNARRFQTYYEFRMADGERMNGRSDSKEPYEVGTGVWVLYLAGNPRTSQLYPLSMFKVIE